MKDAQAFFTQLRTAYLRLGPTERILLPGSVLLVLCCLCGLTIPLLRPRTAATPPASPIVLTETGTPPTPTPLFSFDFPTFTPFPSSTPFIPTPFPTLTSTVTPTGTPLLPTATGTPIPTDTSTPTEAPPSATATRAVTVVIIDVNKPREYVEIQNLAPVAIDLGGWRLVSELGGESCELSGTIEPDEVLRIWSQRGDPGFDCRLGRSIWRDRQEDPAVLYNPEGEEVSRYP